MRTLLPSRRGFTLVELLISIVMMVAIMAATYSLFRSQSTAFRQNTQRFDLTQNARGSIEFAGRMIRTMGSGVSGQQPMLVYGGDAVIAFNADFVERDTVSMRWAAYWNPDVPNAETLAWDSTAAQTLPNTSPGFTYPTRTYRMANGALSPAETHILWFAADATTPRSDDYILWEQVNDGDPEVVARNILAPTGGRPFFEYFLRRTLSTGDTLFVATGSLLPLIRRPLVSGISTADSASYVRPDSVRAVRMNYRISNGETGSAERIRSISSIIDTPNNGVDLPSVCGRAPLSPASFTATEVGVGTGEVSLTWTPSPDQEAGEQDVRQYVIWRRLSSAPAWTEPLLVVRSEAGQLSYTTSVLDNLPGSTYIFGIAAQDCTPSFSSTVTSTVTLSIAP